jgi:hypothetical protein
MSAREVYRRFAELPGILAGSANDPRGLRCYFFSILARELMTLIHEAFRVKSLGGTDSLGESWRSLATRTIRKRQQPRYIQKFPLSARLMILRVSDTLFKSLAPGELVGDDYRPPTNQLYRLTREGLYLGTNVSYAKYVHKTRPLWPAELQSWLDYAIDVALGYVLERLAIQLSTER